MFKESYQNFIFSLFIVLTTAGLCSYFNKIGMTNFYSDIQLSSLNPPNFIFPAVWTVLYVLLVIAFDLVLDNKEQSPLPVTWSFILNMLLQVLWCYAFFGKGYFLAGYIIILVLIVSTIFLIFQFYHRNHIAAYMLIPYLLWLLFAAYLNWSVYDLNGINY